MEGYGININMAGAPTGRYRESDAERWDLDEAERLAYEIVGGPRVASVSIGDGDNEFRMWNADVTDFGNFTYPGGRWAEWYVDGEINGHRWRYRPLSDLPDWESADLLGEILAELHPIVTKVWVGTSDGRTEFEYPTREG